MSSTKTKKFVVLLVCVAMLSVLVLVGAANSTVRDLLRDIRFFNNPCNGADSAFAFYNVGNGDAAAVFTNDAFGLIDTGWDNSVLSLTNHLKTLRIKTIDFVVLSHPHEDHAGGYLHLLKHFTIKKLFVIPYDANDFDNLALYEEIIKVSKQWNIEICYTTHGDVYSIGNINLQFYEQSALTKDENDNSLVVKATAGGASCLFMGDAGHLVENRLLANNCDLKADILKVAHHGSGTATSNKFLMAVLPKYAVISVGPNVYDHPSDTVVSELLHINATVYRTDVCSKVTFYVTNKHWDVEVS